MENIKKYGIIFITIGTLIVIGRIFVTGHFHATGEKIIPELTLIVSFWMSVLSIGLGISMLSEWNQEKKKN
ncbi:hypothetical protein [Bacillus sp. FJAT-45350]|uniref:hypothetical protein n=1 Tax=Bacillus sp. FJAT-45350 TaxID=2011014 RepID=UPI000BB9A13A|nr:hypothetical protein [Bacillus sp. FJAT-45350]